MKKLVMIMAASALALSACGGENGGGIALTQEQKIANTYISEMEGVASAIEAVHDEKSAKQAAATIQEMKTTFEAMSVKYEGKMDSAAGAMAFTAKQQELVAVQSRIGMSMSKLAMSNPALMKIISDEMQDMPDIAAN